MGMLRRSGAEFPMVRYSAFPPTGDIEGDISGLAFYAGFFPRYNRMMAEHGFGPEAAAIAEAWSRGDGQAAERAVTDDLIDATSIAGTPDECPGTDRGLPAIRD